MPVAFIVIVLLNALGLINTLTGSAEIGVSFNASFLALPFYILSAAAVVSDVSGGRIKSPSFLNLLVYISLPFKLLAGPLDSPRLLKDIEALKFKFSLTRLTASYPWIVLGAFMKYVIANRLEPAANIEWTAPVFNILTSALFELKFYFDFAGYSFMGYGGALLFGLHISRNFEHPFFAPNVVMFWRRWHMSLGRFLSRYIFEPNVKYFRKHSTRTIFVGSIFLVSAMWHGGTVNYLFWGLFHSVCYIVFIIYFKREKIFRPLGIIFMILFFIFGRMLAIDSNTGRLDEKILLMVQCFSMRSCGGTAPPASLLNISEAKSLVFAGIFLFLEWVSLRIYGLNRPYHLFRRPIAVFIITVLVVLYGTNNGSLLYARI